MRSVNSARFVTPPLTRRKQEVLKQLLDRFAASVNFCIWKCLEHKVTSRASLHRVAYEEWKSKFNLATHWFHSAGQAATQMFRSWRKLCRQGQADPKRPPVFEDLTGIRQSIRSKRKSRNGKALRKDMRRRLNQWPFRSSSCSSSTGPLRRGYRTKYLPNTEDDETGVRGTSSTCPICGSHNRPNGHVFSCKRCGFVADRHFVGACNVAVRWWTKDVESDVPPEWRRMQPAVERLVAASNPLAEAQKIPCQTGVQFDTEF